MKNLSSYIGRSRGYLCNFIDNMKATNAILGLISCPEHFFEHMRIILDGEKKFIDFMGESSVSVVFQALCDGGHIDIGEGFFECCER